MAKSKMKLVLFCFFIFIHSFLCNAQESRDSEFFIKDKNDYSDDFIKCLREIKEQRFELIDSLLIVNSIDTVVFPIFTDDIIKYENSEKKWRLEFQQINFSTIKYSIYNSDLDIDLNGLATINCSFYLASESSEDENGEMYFVDEYFDYGYDIFLSIRIGETNCTVKIDGTSSPILKKAI
jgi:hypothetical protein